MVRGPKARWRWTPRFLQRRSRPPSLADQTRWVEGLLGLAQSLVSDATVETRLDEVCRFARQLIHCDRSSIYLVEDGVYRARFNDGNPPRVAEVFPNHRVELTDPLIARAVETRSFVVANDASLVNPRLARAAGIRAIVVAPILDEEGEPLGFMTAEYNETVGVFSDLQSMSLLGFSRLVALAVIRERAEQQQAQLASRVQGLERLEAVGRLAGGLAHDFNNLLTVVLGNAEILQPDVPEHALPSLRELQGAASRAASLTRRLLAFGQRQILQPQGVDLHQLLEALQPILRRLMPASIDIELHGRPGHALARVDAGEFDQVVVNLALNARDAMAGSGCLTIETGRVSLDAAYCREHPGVTPGEYALLAVSDTGAGIPRANAERIFEPFFSTKQADGGVGLGLATVYGIVQQSQGHIWLSSEPEKGTTFRVYLPPAERVDAASPRVPGPSRSLSGGETLLVVDDDPGVRRLAVRSLRAQGYEILEAGHPIEARQLAADHEGPIHLLVTDVVMPDSSGPELAEALRRQRPGLPVLYVSGYAENAIVHQGGLDPGTAYLAKPFTPDRLARHVRNELDAARSREP